MSSIIHGGDHSPGIRFKQSSAFGQSHFLPQLLERFNSECFFQLTYAHRNTRLSQMNVLSRSRKIQSRAHGEKHLKISNIHRNQNSKQLLLSLDQFISSIGELSVLFAFK